MLFLANEHVAWHLRALIVGSLLLMGCKPAASTTQPHRKLLRLAVTTSTRDSGLLDILVPVFEKGHNARVDVIAVGTGKALVLGEGGDVDVVLVHARGLEDAFMAAGHGSRREDVMYNTFELLGPADDPAGIQGRLAFDALSRIAATQAKFVSRGDQSGTHQRELDLWKAAGGRPDWTGYLESGQGMGETLIMADQMQAYVLADRGTYLTFRDKIDLVSLAAQSPQMQNPYGVIVVSSAKHAQANERLAQQFVDFLISERGQQLIGRFKVNGEVLFHPLRLTEPESTQASGER